ncbi:MAG: TonB-dependent receptor [Bacillota bacterium]|jgi:outer membrane cobalamin receptor
MGYTLLDTENKKTGKELTGRAKNSVNLGLDWRALPGLKLNVSGLYLGKRWENLLNTKKMDDYFLLNLGLEKKFNEQYRMIFKINNLLGEDGISDAYNLDGVEYYVGIKTRI